MYYISLLFSVPCLILTWLMPFMEEESRFFRYFNVPRAWFCIACAVLFIVIGYAKDKR
jgi:hypothetical protein